MPSFSFMFMLLQLPGCGATNICLLVLCCPGTWSLRCQFPSAILFDLDPSVLDGTIVKNCVVGVNLRYKANSFMLYNNCHESLWTERHVS